MAGLVNALIGIVGLQAYAVAREVQAGRIYDLWAATWPLVWIDVALAVLLLFGWGLAFADGMSGEDTPKSRIFSWLVPDFVSIRRCLASPRGRRRVLAVGAAYGTLLMFLQGIIVVGWSGPILPPDTVYPFLEIWSAPFGWGPSLLWAPNPYLGVQLRPFTIASTLLLSILSAFAVGLGTRRLGGLRKQRVRIQHAGGPLAGLLVACPTCATSPLFAILLGLAAPAGTASAGAVVAAPTFPAASTGLLLSSVGMLWLALARLSRRGASSAHRGSGLAAPQGTRRH